MKSGTQSEVFKIEPEVTRPFLGGAGKRGGGSETKTKVM